MQHTSGDNADKKVTIQQIQTVPQLFVSTWSSGLGTATCINFPSFTPILGQVFSITFVNAFTYDGNANVKINGVTYPIKAHGIQCAKNFCKAGNSFTAMIKTTATTGGTEYVDLDTDCVSVSTSTITQSNGQVVPLNSALSNYLQSKSKDIRDLSSGGATVYKTIRSAINSNSFFFLVEEIGTANFLLAKVFYDGTNLPTKTLISNNNLTLGASNAQGTQVINGCTGSGASGTIRFYGFTI